MPQEMGVAKEKTLARKGHGHLHPDSGAMRPGPRAERRRRRGEQQTTMVRPKTWLAAGAVAMVGVAVMGCPPALAASTRTTVAAPLSATLSPGGGSRSVSLVTPDRVVSRVGGTPAPVPLTVVVSEAAASGDAGGWSVTVQASEFVDAAGHRLSSAALADTDNTLIRSGGGGSAVAVADPGPMDQPETILTDQGQDPGRLYTGIYTDLSQLVLTPPDGTPGGIYTSVLTVTLLS